MTLTTSQANAIYDILVREAGASNREFHRTNFVVAAIREDITEYRFGGALGFGGKFFNTHDTWYVSASPEDMSCQVMSMIMTTNWELAKLKSSYATHTEATV